MGYYQTCWWIKWQLLYCILYSWNLVSGEIRYSVPEELQLGAFVGNIAEDLGLDAKELSVRSFRIVSGARKQYLDVNVDNGIMFVKEKIDREELCGSRISCTLSFEVVLENPPNAYHVEVEIQDVNDNSPRFTKSQIRLEISEGAVPGARFALEYAHDPDVGTNSLETYQLVANDYFSLHVDTLSGDGKLPVLVLEKPLDREKQSTHSLVLTATDGGVPVRTGTAQITIVVQDANDNAPAFPQSVYRVSLLENAPKGTLVLKLNATDLDDGPNGEIVYSFSSHTSARVRELFAVNSKTGEIKVKGRLDYEENIAFEINVQATDKGPNAIPTYCHVLVDVIDVNDNAPEITLTSLFSPVSEASRPGTLVALIGATDRDSGANGKVDCQILNHIPFKLDSSSKNYYRLVTSQLLDRENTSTYDMTIACSDRGSSPLTAKKHIRLEVSDINDNAPRFAQPLYTAHVMENNVIGTSIYSVTALDPDANENSRLTYSLLESQVQNTSVFNYISVNAQNGDVLSQRSFDYEQLKSFQIQVQAQDKGEPALSGNVSVNIIILDQNDNSPVIVSPLPEFGSTVTETVSRLAEPGYLVAKVSAIDADTGQNGRLSYQIVQATDPGLFTISPDTGEIWTIRSVVDKDANKQRLVVVAKDNGSPSLSATVTIMLSVVGGDAEMLSEVNVSMEDPWVTSGVSIYLVIALGTTSSIFLVVLIVLAVKVHKNRNGLGNNSCLLDTCCCLESGNSLNGIQRASRNIQIPPNYVEVFGGDPLSQSFRYGSYSTSGSSKGGFPFSNTHSSSIHTNKGRSEPIGNDGNPLTSNSANYRNSVNNEVKQPNADWRHSQAHRVEVNSSQYLEEEVVQRDVRRDVQREAQREVQRDAQRDPQREVQCEVQHNVQRDVPRAAEKDPGVPRRVVPAKPTAVPEGIESSPVRVPGEQSWTPRLAVKFPPHHQATDYLHNVYIPGTTATLSGKSTSEREGKKSFITFGKKKKSGK
uniref:Protocadherin nu15 n=1 Tax=Callorhinchus milii TaxID=7868 RepID=B0YN99_CALMI|nr:protocadherin nu15 [Callorhinchus milii]